MALPRGKQRCTCLQTQRPSRYTRGNHLTTLPPTAFPTHNQPSQMAGEVHSGPDSLDGVIMPNPLLSPWLYRTWGAFPTQVSRAELCAGPRRERLSQFLNYLGYFNGCNYPLPFYWKKEVNVSGGLLPVSRCIDTPLMEIKKNVEAIGFLDQEQSHHRLAFLTHPQCSSS